MSGGFSYPTPSVLFQESSKDLSATKPLRKQNFGLPLSKDKTAEKLPTLVPGNTSCRPDLSAPCLNSALRLVKEMKETTKARSSKTQHVKLLNEGKVLQKVNFLYEEHLYHDLVALNVSDKDVTETLSRLSSKFQAREKDKEPQLSQFFTPSFSEEYHIPKDVPHRTSKSKDSSNIFSVYERMRSWDSNL